jgi:hypothetical protein
MFFFLSNRFQSYLTEATGSVKEEEAEDDLVSSACSKQPDEGKCLTEVWLVVFCLPLLPAE